MYQAKIDRDIDEVGVMERKLLAVRQCRLNNDSDPCDRTVRQIYECRELQEQPSGQRKRLTWTRNSTFPERL